MLKRKVLFVFICEYSRQIKTKVDFIVTINCTVCFTDSDQGITMIIFEFILITFIASVILEAAGVVAKICSNLKSDHHKQI